MAYQLLLLVHILSSTVLFGTGIGTAFQGLMAHRGRDVRVLAAVDRNVVLADWLFTTPAVVVQPATGIAMARMAGFPLTTGWLGLAVLLYAGIGACWLPVVWIQCRMSRMARVSARDGTPLPEAHARLGRWWFALGWPAFGMMVGIFALMVLKPDL